MHFHLKHKTFILLELSLYTLSKKKKKKKVPSNTLKGFLFGLFWVVEGLNVPCTSVSMYQFPFKAKIIRTMYE